MMVSVVCVYVLLYEDQLSDDPIWFVSVSICTDYKSMSVQSLFKLLNESTQIVMFCKK